METENPVQNNLNTEHTTPSAVNYSSRSARYAASVVDGFVIGLAQIVISLITLPVGGVALNSLALQKSPNFASASASIFTLVFLLVIRILVTPLYFWISTYKYGKSFGKKFFELEIVDEKSGGRLSLWRSFVREILGKFVSGIVFYLGFLWILWDKKRQGWHDKFAHDVVVQKVPLTGFKKVIAYVLLVLGIILPVIAVIVILVTVVLVGINPNSQLEKASDVGVKVAVQQMGNATIVYYDTYHYYPNTLMDLVTAGEIASIPPVPAGYSPFFISVSPAGCTTELKNCTNVAIGGQIKMPAKSGDSFWCFTSRTDFADEASSCTP